MIQPLADEDDPTTQQTWPSGRPTAQTNKVDDVEATATAPTAGDSRRDNSPDDAVKANKGKKRMSTWNLITLSVSMAGAQIAWTVELGYGTPMLLALGLSEQLTSLVWLAGPLSGLIAQPLIGAISDSSTSKYRRRYWIIASTVVLVVSTLILAFCQELATFFVDAVRVGAGDWDEQRNLRVQQTAIGLAIFSFYLLDFALNALQASLRNLLLDVAPPAQLSAGNAWHGRMTNAGNIIGYGFGFLPLADLPFLRWIGGAQFRKFCVICMAILVATVATTCYCHQEEERQQMQKQNKLREILDNIYNAALNLPKSIRRVCAVQLLAFMGWFPFLFYSTTYVGQVMAYELGEEPDADLATRKGELAMLFYSIVGVIAGTVLPHLASRDRRLMKNRKDVNEDAELERMHDMVLHWRAEAARKGKPLRLPVVPFLLRNIWMAALLFYTILTWSTFFITTVRQATIFVSLVGISWAVAMWAPFAIIMELLKEQSTSQPARPQRHHVRAVSSPNINFRQAQGERAPLLRSRSTDRFGEEEHEGEGKAKLAGGTVLGVHNLAIVMPQFVVSIVANIIFRTVDGGESPDPTKHTAYLGKNGVAWVLRFGGLCTIAAALLARRVAPTPTEKEMRRRRAEMALIAETST